jgi:hypothetical protein
VRRWVVAATILFCLTAIGTVVAIVMTASNEPMPSCVTQQLPYYIDASGKVRCGIQDELGRAAGPGLISATLPGDDREGTDEAPLRTRGDDAALRVKTA